MKGNKKFRLAVYVKHNGNSLSAQCFSFTRLQKPYGHCIYNTNSDEIIQTPHALQDRSKVQIYVKPYMVLIILHILGPVRFRESEVWEWVCHSKYGKQVPWNVIHVT